MGEDPDAATPREEEVFGFVKLYQCRKKIMTVPTEEAPAKYVPAAAVIRRGKRYPDLLGVKGRRRLCKSDVKM